MLTITAGQTDCDEVMSAVCREKAKGVTFFEARDGEAVRPMLDVAWAPMLGAFRYAPPWQAHAVLVKWGCG